MPVLHFYTTRQGAYAKARIQASIVTFQLTTEGLAELAGAGVESEGQSFSQTLLNSLIRSREAFTRADAPPEEVDEEALGQFTFDYDADVRAASLIPRCGETGDLGDLHLVVYREAPGRRERATILGARVRKAFAGRVSLSVPIDLLDCPALDHLIATRKVSDKEHTVQRLASWFREGHAPTTENTPARPRRQQMLGLPDEESLMGV